jgi:hypothetical protein
MSDDEGDSCGALEEGLPRENIHGRKRDTYRYPWQHLATVATMRRSRRVHVASNQFPSTRFIL